MLRFLANSRNKMTTGKIVAKGARNRPLHKIPLGSGKWNIKRDCNTAVLKEMNTSKTKDSSIFLGVATGSIFCSLRMQCNESSCDGTVEFPLIDNETQISSAQVMIETGILENVKSYLESALRKMIEYFYSAKRILFCSTVAAPAVIAAPVALYFGKEDELWDYLIWSIETLGPTFIKLAQWASTRPDLFPDELTKRLMKLQDSTRIHPLETAEKTLEEAFGSSWRTHLILDPEPIGSGCIAQVYKGVFKAHGKNEMDQPVAVKLIHPHIKETIAQDMHILKAFIWLLEKFPSLSYMSLSHVVDQFANSMQNQLDLRQEAAHMERFSRDFKDNINVEFAKPIKGFVTQNVLVETLMEGRPIAKFMSEETETALKLRISSLCTEMMLKMVFLNNFVHGDLHPGNILVKITKSGPKLIFLDCGIVTEISTSDHKTFIDICLSLLHFDGTKAGLLMLEHRGFQEDDIAVKGFCEGIQGLVERAKTENTFEHISDYISTICGLSCKYRVQLLPDVLNVAMAVKVCEGIALALNPQLELAKVAIPTVIAGQAKYYMKKAFGTKDE